MKTPEEKAARATYMRVWNANRTPEQRERGNASRLAWARANPEKRRASVKKFDDKPESKRRQRDLSLQRLCGATIEEFEALVEEQHGLCACCGTRQCKDADHSPWTGRLRAILCNQCNQALGLLQEQPHITAAATRYLALHEGAFRGANL
jgi:hypothetical protein